MNPIGRPVNIVQDNHSGSVRNVLRGLHYRTRQAQGKPVRIVQVEVFDVVLDIRKASPTFGQWVGEILSGENKRQPWMREGFVVLSFKNARGAVRETAEGFP